VNVVNPDAVLRGSRIWQGEWAQQRAAQYKKSVDELESVYRERSLLKRSVYPGRRGRKPWHSSPPSVPPSRRAIS
jgi:hypothetical protein